MTPIARTSEPIIAPTKLVRPMDIVVPVGVLPQPSNDVTGAATTSLLQRRRERFSRRQGR